jgi:uncharacterized protein (DUF2249 family)
MYKFPMTHVELDVRTLPKPEKHPAIFQAYAGLPVGDSLLLINNHNPRHLRDEFEVEFPGGYGWDYEESGPQRWQIRITKLASTALPRALAADLDEHTGSTGAIWTLPMSERDLDANIVNLPPGSEIAAHDGPDNDVLVVVFSGAGRIDTEREPVELHPGALAWLPRRSRRAIRAGADGLRYLTVHQRRTNLTLGILNASH